jgi:glycosyltransferase involved in cell wall biosynthesis
LEQQFVSTSPPRQPTIRRTKPLVLHVVEAYGGGVAAVLTDYVASLPDVEHVVLAYRRPGSQIGNGLHGRADLIDLPSGKLAQLMAVRRTVKRLRPDVIHAHSSYAGGYVRAACPRRGARVVYSPHCYAFQRRDVPGVVRAGYWLMEAVLSFRTDAVAAVGAWEQVLAHRLPRPSEVVFVPHHVQLPADLVTSAEADGGPVVAVGRIRPQKDPAFFAAAARDARLLGGNREWRWVGGGDEDLERLLRDSGVTVTGWQPRERVLRELANAHAYVHTAAWEGNPVTVLEAASVGLPIVARDIPPVRHAGVDRLAATPIDMAQQVLALDDLDRWRGAMKESAEFVSRTAATSQGAALRRLYGLPPAEETAAADAEPARFTASR